MKVYTCRDCGDCGYGPCVLIVEDENEQPVSCPYPNPGATNWLLRVDE